MSISAFLMAYSYLLCVHDPTKPRCVCVYVMILILTDKDK